MKKDKNQNKQYKHRMSFRTSFFIFVTGFFVLVIMALWLMQDVYVNNFNEYVKTDKAKMMIHSVQRYADVANSDELLKELAIENAVCIEMIYPTITKSYFTENDDCILHKLSEDKIKTLIQKTNESDGTLQAYFMRTDGEFNGTIYYDKLPFSEVGLPKDFVLCKMATNANGDNYYILINATIAPLDAAVATFRAQLGYLILGASVFFVLIAIYITMRFSKPIENINREARNLVKANYDVHFQDSKAKELSELSQTLNYVAKELSQTEAVRREFIANVSHDLRTPLTLIGGYAEAIKDMPDSYAESADVIIEEVHRLSKLVSDMLELSVMQSGQYKPNFEDINLTELVSDIVNRLNKFHEKENVRIDFVYSQNILLSFDEVKITQVIYNLLINAIKFSPVNKNIIVTQYATVNEVKIEVKDKGLGMSPEILPHIFERYYKDKKTQVGTGLGLSIVKAVMEMHGGQYGVSSEQGNGSVFWFSLPIK